MANAYNDLWAEWKKHPTDDNLAKLLDAFSPDIRWVTTTFAKADVPDYVVEAEAKRNLVKAFQMYDPSRGVSLRTFAVSYLKKTNRLVYEYQNPGKVPEARILNFAKFDASKEKLMKALGRDPSSMEIANDLRWDVKEVIRMENERRPTISGEVAEMGQTHYDFASDSALTYIYYSLPNHLRPIFEVTTGFGGAPILAAADIKNKLKIDDAKYRTLRNELQEFLKKNHMAELLQ